MAYYILCLIIWIIGQYAANLIMVSAFDPKKNTSTALGNATIVTGLMMPIIILKYFCFEVPAIRELSLVAAVLIDVIYIHICMKGKTWQKLLFLALQEVTFLGGEMLVVLMFNQQMADFSGLDYHTPIGLAFCVVAYSINLTLYFLVLSIWKRFIMKRSYSNTGFLVFALFPISQILLTYASSQVIFQGIPINVTYNIIGTIIGFIADGFLMVMLLRQQHMLETDQRLKDLQNAWAIEQNHYHEIETRREELAKIRHDLKDQLIVMQQLTIKQEYDQILTMLNTLTDYVAGTKENVYCADSVVNAIMAENERKCAANDITLEYDLKIPVPLQMNPVVICNLFSNLFRNAIRAVCEIKNPAITKQIVLKATLKGNYLHVKMENPYTKEIPASKKFSAKADRRHYGLEILQDIAELQNGQMEIKQNTSTYITSLSVENSNLTIR